MSRSKQSGRGHVHDAHHVIRGPSTTLFALGQAGIITPLPPPIRECLMSIWIPARKLINPANDETAVEFLKPRCTSVVQ